MSARPDLKAWLVMLAALMFWAMFAAHPAWAQPATPADAAGQRSFVTLSTAQEARAQALGRGLRCPICRGLSIAESPSDLARQMLTEVRAQVAGGASDDSVRAYFVTRYGQSVLLAPPASGLGLIVWLGPLVALLGGSLALALFLRRAARVSPKVKPEFLALARREIAAPPELAGAVAPGPDGARP